MVKLGEIPGVAIIIVIVAITLSMGGEVLDDMRDDQTVNSTAWNASTGGLEAIDTFASWLDTIALIIIVAVIIGVLAYLRFAGGV